MLNNNADSNTSGDLSDDIYTFKKINKKSAFTIVEMLVVMVILGIFSTIVVSLISHSSQSYLRGMQQRKEAGIVQTAIDDITRQAILGERIRLFVIKKSDLTEIVTETEISGVSQTVTSNTSGVPDGALIYEDGSWQKFVDNKPTGKIEGQGQLVGKIVGGIPFDDEYNFSKSKPIMLKGEGIDISSKKFYVNNRIKDSKNISDIFGLPYATGFYAKMDLTLEIERNTIVSYDEKNKEIIEYGYIIFLSGNNKNGFGNTASAKQGFAPINMWSE